MPVLFHYHTKRLSFGLGPGFGYLIHQREFYGGGGDLAADNPFSTLEVSFNADVGILFTDQVLFNLRYTNSILPTRTSSSVLTGRPNRNYYNHVISAALAYRFKKSKEKKEE